MHQSGCIQDNGRAGYGAEKTGREIANGDFVHHAGTKQDRVTPLPSLCQELRCARRDAPRRAFRQCKHERFRNCEPEMRRNAGRRGDLQLAGAST
jgi:hypothetical protein